MSDNYYPQWICHSCGVKMGRYCVMVSCYHNGDFNDENDRCGWCGSAASLTEPRDYGYPKFNPEVHSITPPQEDL